jgi:membrane protein insertase Oxa1/YidC/SpoIIIJ
MALCMPVRLIFRKLGLKENEPVMMAAYGGFYFFLCLALLLAFTAFTGRMGLAQDLGLSLGLGIVMCLVYVIKLQVYKAMAKMRKGKP